MGFNLLLDGSSDSFATVRDAEGSTLLRDLGEEFTIDLWAHVAAGDTVQLVRRGWDPQASWDDVGWAFSVTRTRIEARFFPYFDHEAPLDPPLPTGWHHIAWTYLDGDSILFVDGEPVAPTTCYRLSGGQNVADVDGVVCRAGSGFVNFAADVPVRLGAVVERNGGVIGTVPGGYDEIRISNQVRYPGAFEPVRRAEPDSETLGLWHLDEGSGTVSVDSSGNRQRVTLSDGAIWGEDDGYGRFCSD